MSITVTALGGRSILFGRPKEVPVIPKGFTLIASSDDWLFADRKDGSRWYVSKARLTRMGIATQKNVAHSIRKNPCSKMKVGDRFFDRRCFIKFNPETGEVIP